MFGTALKVVAVGIGAVVTAASADFLHKAYKAKKNGRRIRDYYDAAPFDPDSRSATGRWIAEGAIQKARRRRARKSK